MKKRFLSSALAVLLMSNNVFAAASVSIKSAEQNEDGIIKVECSIEDADITKQLTVSAVEVEDDTYLNTLIYVDQFKPEIAEDTSFGFEFKPARQTDTSKAYIVRVGGAGADTPDKKVIVFYDANVFIAGDVNNDGNVNKEDAALVLKFISGSYSMTEKQKKAANVNGGDIDITDAIEIIKSTPDEQEG